jgi:hypothetical protein
MTVKATIDPEARTFSLSGGSWIGTYPISDYEKWVFFYREQQERYAPHARSYQPTVDALAGISAQIHVLRTS